MDGLVNLYKPLGLTSARALERARSLLGPYRSGHAGSLDPLADGVLLICIGRGTKLVERLMDQPKIYRAEARLDVTSDSYDGEHPARPVAVEHIPDLAAVRAALAGLEGEIPQVPPASSAVKVGGKPAYKLFRAGRDPVLAARPVRIYWLHLHRFEWPVIELEIACGRGTYIRALIRDLGTALGAGGCLTRLSRLAVGPFKLAESWTFERLAVPGAARSACVPPERALKLLAGPAAVPPRPAAGG